MIRLAGVDLPQNKRLVIALMYIQGIGLKTSKEIIQLLKIDGNTRVRDISEVDVVKLRKLLENYTLEGDLRRFVAQSLKRLREIGSYRGTRHRRKLPARGQRTHTNARTRRGKAVAVAGKKKVTK
ncbi:MAG: 30S ribosomal protein S13 [Candidatus Marinamargulisbacteria bacterium]|jgi:small subunit ribosomal protein S13|nr:30S ribosomal protein S13 [bacterium]MDG2264575.1 30S ribosomal protein S13 [Candidatus Marinamargulisbacteria bacterium]|tara:strand:+ start:9534 stop:9908 length:375 start_codon:yes stop_codon:yes gene_type:complete